MLRLQDALLQPPPRRRRGRLLGAMIRRGIGFGLLALGALALVQTYRGRSPRPSELGELQASPAAGRLTVRVGKPVEFSAAAEGALGFAWSVSGRPVSREPTWSYVPESQDAGLQQVKVVVAGPDGTRVRRAWDVVVETAVAPEIVETDPPAGIVTLSAGGTAKFRCNARLPNTESSDGLRFAWTVDERAVQDEQRPGTQGASELVLPLGQPGLHRVVARVREVDAVSSLAEWTLVVTPREPSSVVARRGGQPTNVAATEGPPSAESAPARLVHAPGPRRLERDLGESLALSVRTEPDAAAVSYVWTLDGRLVREENAAKFDYAAGSPGRHRIAVTVLAGGRKIGDDAWVVTVRPPGAAEPPVSEVKAEPTVETPAEVVSAAPPPPRGEVAPAEPPPPHAEVATAAAPPPRAPAAPASLLEDEVRRWLVEYAQAWSRKDLAALRRMGQVQTAAQAEQLERYFRSIDDISVDVHVLALHIEGDRASVEFERTDTLTDPAGKRRELRLPPLRKEIERTPHGLRFAELGGHS